MNGVVLDDKVQALMRDVFERHPEIERVVLFGSRAKGNAKPNSDVDLAVYGSDGALRPERIALDLDELPFAYKFEVIDGGRVDSDNLRAHIERVGVSVYERE